MEVHKNCFQVLQCTLKSTHQKISWKCMSQKIHLNSNESLFKQSFLRTAAVRRARENSLSCKGAKMFNLLPADLRNITSDKVLDFKSKLDLFLREVADEPTTAGVGRVAETNSLLHQLPLAKQQRNRWDRRSKRSTSCWTLNKGKDKGLVQCAVCIKKYDI